MITACIITKNQQEKLKKCLEALRKYQIPMVVIDTGSEDESRNIALQYTDRVFDFPWINDFAAAKNFAISKADTEYVLIIDSDEYICQFDWNQLQLLIKNNPGKVGRVKRINIYSEKGQPHQSEEFINRIFHKEDFTYEGRIHEQVVAKDGKDFETYLSGIVMEHDGYELTDEERKNKTERNIVLLKKELEEFRRKVGDTDILILPKNLQTRGAYLWYQLGKSYYMRGEYKESVTCFEEALSFDLNEHLEFVFDMVETYGYALINSNQYRKALDLEGVYDVFSTTADFCFLMGLIYMKNGCFEDAVAQYKKATTFPSAKVVGTNSYLAFYNIGVIFECMGNIVEAKHYYKKALPYDKAMERLQQIAM